MRVLAALGAALALASCAGSRAPVSAPPVHGVVSIEVSPNPILAVSAGPNLYDFPFDVIIRETGGRPLQIRNVVATMFAFAGMKVGSESHGAADLKGRGFATEVAAHGELRYHFAPQQGVPDVRLFAGVSATLEVDAVDDTGAATTASVHLTVKSSS